jgi:hypothetical protein
MVTTTTINIQLGTAFWLLVALLIAVGILWLVLGNEGMSRAIRGGLQDSFNRRTIHIQKV